MLLLSFTPLEVLILPISPVIVWLPVRCIGLVPVKNRGDQCSQQCHPLLACCELRMRFELRSANWEVSSWTKEGGSLPWHSKALKTNCLENLVLLEAQKLVHTCPCSSVRSLFNFAKHAASNPESALWLGLCNTETKLITIAFCFVSFPSTDQVSPLRSEEMVGGETDAVFTWEIVFLSAPLTGNW